MRSWRAIERRHAYRRRLLTVAEGGGVGEGGVVGRQVGGGERRRGVVDGAQERDQVRHRGRIAVEDVRVAARPSAPVGLDGRQEIRVRADAERFLERGRLRRRGSTARVSKMPSSVGVLKPSAPNAAATVIAGATVFTGLIEP